MSQEKPVGSAVRLHVHRLARLIVRSMLALASIIGAGIVSILLGFSGIPSTVPLFALVRQHPIVSVVIGIGLIAITGASLIVLRQPQPSSERPVDPAVGRYSRRLAIASAISVGSVACTVAVISVVLIQPTWCPEVVCRPPILLTNTEGVHDSNLELYFTALASTAYEIPNDPQSYSLGNLPTSIPAVRLDEQSVAPPYRVVMGVHSLSRGPYSISIERVVIVVGQVLPVPHPLNVWMSGTPPSFTSQPYEVTYSGQDIGSELLANYGVPHSRVELVPGEADSLALQISSKATIDFQFHVQVSYRITNESIIRTLALPRTFEAVFSNASDWHSFHLDKGRFVADP